MGTALRGQFTRQLQKWETDNRVVRCQDAAAFGRELDVWVAQVQREVMPSFPGAALALSAAFLALDRVVFGRVDDGGGCIGGAFERACQRWLTAAAEAGLSEAEIANRAMAMLSADSYGARSALNRAITRCRTAGFRTRPTHGDCGVAACPA